MDKYGIDNVRGGSFVQIILDKTIIDNIVRRNRNANDKCFICGNTDHFAKDCKHKNDDNIDKTYDKTNKIDNKTYDKTNKIDNKTNKIDKIDDKYNCKYCDKEFYSQKGCSGHENLYCKNKNKSNSCSSNEFIQNKSSLKTVNNVCNRCQRKGHIENDCYATTDINNNLIEDMYVCDYCNKEFDDEKKCVSHEKICKKNNECSRCHRTSHDVNDCYATIDINGKEILDIEVFSCNYCNKQFDSLKGATYHQNVYCKIRKHF